MIEKLVKFLKLKKRYSITLKRGKKQIDRAYHWGMFTKKGKLVRHQIEIYVYDLHAEKRNLQTIIAHELIHAWQAEYAPNSKCHGRKFQMKAAEIEREFGIRFIYLPECDV